MANDDLSELRLLRLSELLALVPLSRATIYRRMREKTFPQALKIGERAVAWRYLDIKNYIASSPLYR
jgi:prophage regulatory protein